MSTTDSQPIERPSQFQLRHVGIVVVVLAITLAIAAPWLRQWTSNDWLVLLRYTGCIGMGVVIYFLLHGWQLLAVQRQAGQVITAIRSPAAKYRDIVRCVLGALFIAFLCAFGIAQVHLQANAPPADFFSWVLMTCILPIQLSYSVSLLFRRSRRTRLCENGLVLEGVLFVPWQQLQRWNWSSAAPNKLLIYSKNMQVGAFGVPLDQREEIEAILHERRHDLDADS